jgi:hypothetical protein
MVNLQLLLKSVLEAILFINTDLIKVILQSLLCRVASGLFGGGWVVMGWVVGWVVGSWN